MIRLGPVLFLLTVLAIGVFVPVHAQTVVSTHSGVLYFFEGSVFLAGDRVEQKFGRFPDIGEGRELKTEQGRAEVLLTPGVCLRLSDQSAIRLVSERLEDTRVELLHGSAILEVNQTAPGTAAVLIYKQWEVRAPHQGVYRIDSDPPRLSVYRGDATVSTREKAEAVAVNDGETLPLAAVLVPDRSTTPGIDSFKAWAMNRSQAVSSDNAVAGEILDDPNQMDSLNSTLGGFTYFPPTGAPSLGIGNPYGVSFWSPYQPMLNSAYVPAYFGPLYPGWPIITPLYVRPGALPTRIGIGLRPGTMPQLPVMSPRPSPRPIPRPVAPPPRVGVHR